MNPFERKHIRDIALRNRKIGVAVDDAMKDIARRYTTVKGKRFAGVLNDRLKELHEQILNNGKDGIRNQWMLANEKNNKGLDGYLSSVKISDRLNQSFRSPNLSALNAFIDRTEKGMNLSDRVWNFTDSVKESMEGLIKTGVLEGKSAIALSKELKGYVNGKPIRYEGTLIPAKNLNFQAIRLAATEMNMAFRTSDYLQNSRLPFVTGVTIELSASHPREDICDFLVGDYPKGYLFQGFHPLCICFATYNNIPKEQFVEYIKTGKMDTTKFTTDIPPQARLYLNENGKRLMNYKNTPYFLRENYTKDLKLKKSVSKINV